MRDKIRIWKQKLPYTAASLLPKWLVYYATIRLISHATTGKHENQIVPELTAIDALKRWEHV